MQAGRLLSARDPRELTVTRSGRPSGCRAGVGGNGASAPDAVPYCPLRPAPCWASAKTAATCPTGRSAWSTVDTAEASPLSARTAPTRPSLPAVAGVPATTAPRPAPSSAETRSPRVRSRAAGSSPAAGPEVTTRARSAGVTWALSTRSIRRLAKPATTSLVTAAAGSRSFVPSSPYASSEPDSTPASSLSGSWKPAGWPPPVTYAFASAARRGSA